MPGLRAVVFLNAGIFRVPYWKFIAFDGGAALISVPVWIWVGAKFSEQLHHLLGEARIASYVIAGLLAAAILASILWERRHLARKQRLLEASTGGDYHSSDAVLHETRSSVPESKSRDATKANVTAKDGAKPTGASGVGCTSGERAG